MITSICQQCGKKVVSKRSAYHWCSDECKIQRDASQKLTTWLIVCDGCGKVFETDNPRLKYCSPDCPGRDRPEPVRMLTCSDCGRTFRAVGRRPRARCVECAKKYKSYRTMVKRKEKHPETQIGVGSGNAQHWKTLTETEAEARAHKLELRRKRYYERKLEQGAAGFTHLTYRKIAISMHGAKCYFCGYDDFFEALETHHRDMDRTNNNDDNLFILCANCHRIIHTRISNGLRNNNDHAEEGKAFVTDVFDTVEAEVKQRKNSGTSSMSQSDLKDDRDVSQGQSIPAGEELPSADTRPLQGEQLELDL